MHPSLRDLATTLEVIDDQNHLVIVITVKYLDVDASFCHLASKHAKLAGNILL